MERLTSINGHEDDTEYHRKQAEDVANQEQKSDNNSFEVKTDVEIRTRCDSGD
jgi:hypothetical protein